MKVQLTKDEVLRLSKELEQINKQMFVMPFKMSYAIIKTSKKLKEEASIIEEIVEPQRVKLLEELCDKDENGKCIIKKDEFVLSSENLKKYSEKFKELVKDKVEIELFGINKADIPDSLQLPNGVIATISDFIYEEIK